MQKHVLPRVHQSTAGTAPLLGRETRERVKTKTKPERVHPKTCMRMSLTAQSGNYPNGPPKAEGPSPQRWSHAAKRHAARRKNHLGGVNLADVLWSKKNTACDSTGRKFKWRKMNLWG